MFVSNIFDFGTQWRIPKPKQMRNPFQIFLTWNILKQNMGLEFEGKRLSWNSAVYSKIALVFAEQKNGVVDLVLDFHLLTAHLQRSRSKRHSNRLFFVSWSMRWIYLGLKIAQGSFSVSIELCHRNLCLNREWVDLGKGSSLWWF